MRLAEYIWIDANGGLRCKTKVIGDTEAPPEWGFDGSSTGQADGDSSDCILKPVRIVNDPYRDGAPDILVLCEVYNADGTPGKGNYRATATKVWANKIEHKPWFGIEQEYTIYKDGKPLCLFGGKEPPEQGPFYCSPGALGFSIAEDHMEACMQAKLRLSGINAEVMPGQWEFQIGPGNPILVGDHLMIARFLLLRAAATQHAQISFNAKPHPMLNGAGAHTNFSTIKMREAAEGLYHCALAAESLGIDVTGSPIEEDKVYDTNHYPEAYGTGYKDRLTGLHETCSWKQFKYGVADRTASIRIPLHVKNKGNGYIEDRRPCANADPYRVMAYIMESCCK